MSGIRVAFLVLALFFIGMLVLGVRTGQMPEKAVDIDRAHPTMFWIGGAIYVVFAIGCLYGAFTATYVRKLHNRQRFSV